MKTILCTNNKYEDPFLHSQLLNLYNQIDFIEDHVLFCRKKKKELTKESIVNIEYGRFSFLLYFIKLFLHTIKTDERETIFHLRGFVSAFIFYLVKKIIFWKKLSYIYDPRGAYIIELEESGAVRNSNLLKFLRIVEFSLIQKSESTIVTTHRFKILYTTIYGLEKKYIVLYNATSFSSEKRINLHKKDNLNLCYVGSINYWHDLDEIVRVLDHINNISYKKCKVFVFTNYNNQSLVEEKLENNLIFDYEIRFVPYNNLKDELEKMDICISVVKPTVSTQIASPIKISDYIGLNKIMILNSGIGDFDNFFKSNNSAIVYPYGNSLEFTYADLFQVRVEKNEDLKKHLSLLSNVVQLKQIISNKFLLQSPRFQSNTRS